MKQKCALQSQQFFFFLSFFNENTKYGNFKTWREGSGIHKSGTNELDNFLDHAAFPFKRIEEFKSEKRV